ncbi:acetyl-CoA carboxylase biotin carboxyl carrier protein subunit [Enterococcus quebecensis]|uniref:Acetyl-CoA carboxylase biotin carboxyl carrier protein subunit n=1 Tax=Enterococcus quebecensis TaxID=903983 RepID=A0A1E5H365_9ENTE|nr:acetyl-CoA carboxylase biotin carboxyl carrier protein subunit [Enterococcus quebecensis]OEG19356.1 acetyl-CoA carboxylase biotin carboxyl carrier protein subunit [Enterococcus quebecensis]OJG75726.1 acetyl-CoA carboxylase biotin carboxyl carrier protein subunit [Enterococcus quebecensis]
MLRKFKISIDGKEYLVEMEEIGGVPQAPIAVPVTPTPPVVEAAPTPTPVEQTPTPVTPASVGNDAMTSPMPGTILKILVNVGDEVKENQPLLILEAMKMENEVVATADGKVTGLHITLGQVVNAGDALITID